jgi:hypothetical protein
MPHRLTQANNFQQKNQSYASNQQQQRFNSNRKGAYSSNGTPSQLESRGRRAANETPKNMKNVPSQE